MRRLLTLICLCLPFLNATAQADWDFLAQAASQQAQINGAGGGGGTDINAGLAAWWPLDDGTGTTATNGVSGSPSITSLTLHTWQAGQFGNSLNWTNTDTRTYGTGVNPSIGGKTVARFSVWMRRAASSDKPYWALVANDATSLLGVAISWQNDDAVRISFTNGQNVAFTLLSSTVNTWENIIWTYNAGAGGTHTNWVRGYLNGTPQNMTFTGTVPPNIHADATNSYPCRNPVGGSYYIGQLDSFRIWTNIAIGADVISSLQTNQ